MPILWIKKLRLIESLLQGWRRPLATSFWSHVRCLAAHEGFLPLIFLSRRLCLIPTARPDLVLMSRILFKDNTEKNLIRFEQEDLNCETSANFPTWRAGNEPAGLLRTSRNKERHLGWSVSGGVFAVCPGDGGTVLLCNNCLDIPYPRPSLLLVNTKVGVFATNINILSVSPCHAGSSC